MGQPFYSGGDLFGYHTSDPSKILDIAKQIAYGIYQIHRSGFLYGDLKVENTFWVDAEKTHLVLADFGLVTPCMGGGVCTDVFAGTPQLLSPSIVSRKKYGFEVDWWAFGVMLQDIVDGRSCYERLSCASHKSGKCVKVKFNKENTYKAIKTGDCQFASKIQERKHADLLRFIKRISTKNSFETNLENDNARARMQSECPANHPVLSDPYFFQGDELYTGWNALCIKHYGQDECTRAPSLGSLCTGGDSKMQQTVSQKDPQESLLSKLAVARDAQPQVHACDRCKHVCSSSTWVSHYKGDSDKASRKMANACEFVTKKGITLQATQCGSLGVSNNSPRRKCCKCIASQCLANPSCFETACPS